MNDYIEIDWENKQIKTKNKESNNNNNINNNMEILNLIEEIKQIKDKFDKVKDINNEVIKLELELKNFKSTLVKTIANIRSNFERLYELNIKAVKRKQPINVNVNLDEIKCVIKELSMQIDNKLSNLDKQLYTIHTKLDDIYSTIIASRKISDLNHINSRITAIESKIDELKTLIEKLHKKKKKSWWERLIGV